MQIRSSVGTPRFCPTGRTTVLCSLRAFDVVRLSCLRPGLRIVRNQVALSSSRGPTPRCRRTQGTSPPTAGATHASPLQRPADRRNIGPKVRKILSSPRAMGKGHDYRPPALPGLQGFRCRVVAGRCRRIGKCGGCAPSPNPESVTSINMSRMVNGRFVFATMSTYTRMTASGAEWRSRAHHHTPGESHQPSTRSGQVRFHARDGQHDPRTMDGSGIDGAARQGVQGIRPYSDSGPAVF